MPQRHTKHNIKSSYLDYILVFLLVVMSAGVSFLGATIFRFPLVLLAFWLVLKRRKQSLLPNYKYVYLFWSVWIIVFSIYFSFNYDYSVFSSLITYLSFITLLIAAVFSSLAINNLFKTYIKVIYHLSIISFVFYLIQLTNFDLLLNILQSFDGINAFFKDSVGRPSIVIASYPLDAGFIYRNSGFATEPGEFGVFLVMALLLQLSLNKCTIDKKVIVLTIAIITTFSTAGYIGLAVAILYYVNNSVSSVKRIALAIILIPAIYFIVRLDFVIDKVNHSIERESISYEYAYTQRITPGRFGSLILDINDFKSNPLVGYGVSAETRYVNFFGVEQQRTNGLSDYLVKFGLFGFLFMMYGFYKSFLLIKKNNSSIKGLTLFLLFGLFSVSFSQVILATPLFFTFQYYHYQQRNAQSYNREKKF